MDGIGNIGGPQKLGHIFTGKVDSTREKTAASKQPQESFFRGDQDSSMSTISADILKGQPKGEQKPVIELPKTEIKDPQAQIEYFNKPEQEITAYEGFYLAGQMGDENSSFAGFDLNGPSTLGKGIVTLSGQNINNPKFLMQE